MHDIEQTYDEWWDILADDQLVVSVCGKHWAGKYVTALGRGSRMRWRLRLKSVSDALDDVRIPRPEDCGLRRRTLR